jgi:putative FmdB family regulatory protein
LPTYSYRCTECDNAFDIQQAFTDDSLTVCPVCGGKLRKVFGAVGVTFNGSGSTGEKAYQWAGDGISSTDSSLTHDFGSPGGTYTVGLTVTGPGGSDSTFVNITVPCP